MTDEQQAAAYRAEMLARTRNKAARERALAGSTSARQELQADWQPMIDWFETLEANHDGEDPEEYGQIFNLNPGID